MIDLEVMYLSVAALKMEQKGVGMEENAGIEESQEEQQSHNQRADLRTVGRESTEIQCQCH